MEDYNERELEGSYPVHAGYLYICDGEIWKSDTMTTVGALKVTHGFGSVKNCDIGARELWHLT